MSGVEEMDGDRVSSGLVRRPLLGVALAFIVGMLADAFSRFPPVAGMLIGVAAVSVAFTAALLSGRVRESLRCATLFIAVAIVAWVAAGFAATEPGAAPVAGLDSWADGRRIRITGLVDADPETPVMARGSVWVFPLRVEEVACGAVTNEVCGWVRVRWIGQARGGAPRYGERWSVEGRLAARPGRNPEWRLVLTGGHWGSRRLSTGYGSAIKTWCYAARKRAGEMLTVGIADRPATAGVLRALMLGYRADLDPELHDLFVSTGTLHIFAISGSHIVILAGLVLVVVRALRVPRTWWGGAVVPLLAGFTLATGAEASAVRACVMASIFWIAPLFGRKPDALSALALSALLILGADPGQLREAGFVFSFAVVLGLIVMHPLVERRLRPLWRKDPLKIEAEGWWVDKMRETGKYVAGLVSLTLVAWAVSTPITACWFGRFTLCALPSNLVVVPASGLVMLSGCLSLLLGQVWVGFADVFNNASLGLIEVMLWVLRHVQGMPAGNMPVEPWSMWTVGAWYGVLAAWVGVEQARQSGAVMPLAEAEEQG